MWSPMIDVSEHQGTINFATMRARGVPYLILRVSHGATQDARVGTYYRDAIGAGYQPWQIGFYSFINPKRGTAAATAESTASMIRSLTGRTDVLYMLDVENYRDESPNRGTQPISGSRFAQYLRDHRRVFETVMPSSRVIAYSNSAYWDSQDGPRDPVLAAELEWMVPRYPRYSTVAYERGGYPPEPPMWDEYALGMATGPYPPNGSGLWEGWQFSAGYNRQGARYGCQSSDLDLNIIRTSAAVRWFPAPLPPPPPQKDDSDVQIRFTTTKHTGQILIGAGPPLFLTPAMVAGPFKDVPKLVGVTPEDDARWLEYKAIYDASQVAPFPPADPGDPGTVPNVWRITGTIDAATDQA